MHTRSVLVALTRSNTAPALAVSGPADAAANRQAEVSARALRAVQAMNVTR